MRSSQKNRLARCIFIFLFLPGCSSLSFKILNQTRNKTELQVAPNRIILQCEDVQDPTEPIDRDGRYGLMIHVLDEENTVLTVSQGNVLGKKDCFERIKRIEKILKNGKQIYMGGMGSLENPRKKYTEWPFYFPGKGEFYSNSRALQFMVIMNEKKECFSAHYGNGEPCPPEEFPIRK